MSREACRDEWSVDGTSLRDTLRRERDDSDEPEPPAPRDAPLAAPGRRRARDAVGALVGLLRRRARAARRRGARARRGLRRRDAAGLAVARAVAEFPSAPEARVLLGCSLLCIYGPRSLPPTSPRDAGDPVPRSEPNPLVGATPQEASQPGPRCGWCGAAWCGAPREAQPSLNAIDPSRALPQRSRTTRGARN